jgi:AraC-like DNA-binding protein
MNSSIHRISKSFHTPRISDLAALTCLGEKQFERKFGQFVGMKPMQFIRSIRFQRALHLKRMQPNLSLTQLALEVGYYDQAHFTNEFKIFTGMTPKKYFSQHNAFSDYFDL